MAGSNRETDPWAFALDVVAMLRDGRLALVPQDPTPSMVSAGMSAGPVTADDVLRIWRAMMREVR
ncbi:MAG TPA: hypothetical protein VEY95_16485 [Azospirillaceae bacterium]|nr:hypothetical protein [Azospirillaceae bacterium]